MSIVVNTASHTSAGFTSSPVVTTLAAAVSAGDTIVLILSAENNTGTLATTSITDNQSLSWTRRYTNIFTGGVATLYEEWAAPAVSGIGAGDLTVTTTYNATIHDGGQSLFSVTGVNAWDANGSLPAVNNLLGGGATDNPSVSGVSTTAANTVVFGVIELPNGGAWSALTPGAGWTLADSWASRSDENCQIIVQYQVFTSPQSSISVAFSGPGFGSNNVVIADALAAGSTEVDISASMAIGVAMAADVDTGGDIVGSDFAIGLDMASTVTLIGGSKPPSIIIINQ